MKPLHEILLNRIKEEILGGNQINLKTLNDIYSKFLNDLERPKDIYDLLEEQEPAHKDELKKAIVNNFKISCLVAHQSADNMQPEAWNRIIELFEENKNILNL